MRAADLIKALPEQTQIDIGERALRLLGGSRLIGADTIGPYLALTGEPGDIAAVLKRTRGMHSWINAWRETAEARLDAAASATSHTGRVRYVRTACAYLAFANQGHALPDVYREVSHRLVSAHSQIHHLVEPVYEPVGLELEDGAIAHGLLRVPAAERESPVPVVVMCQGLERVKEQAFHLEAALLARRVAVLNVDQPGVGETLAKGVHASSASRVDALAAAARDFCTHTRRLDENRLGVYGHSMGGAIALAISAAAGARATATLAAPVVLDIDDAPAIFRPRARWATGVDTNAEFAAVMAELDIRARIGEIDEPVLAIHGDADTVVPTEQVYEIAARARGDVEIRIFPRGDHTCSQYSAAVWSLIADFFADRLDVA